MGVKGYHHAPFNSRYDLVPIARETGWVQKPVGTGAGNLVPIGIWSPDRSVRSESLYRLSYPGPYTVNRNK